MLLLSNCARFFSSMIKTVVCILVQGKLFPEKAAGIYRDSIASTKYLQPGYIDAFDEETMKVSRL